MSVTVTIEKKVEPLKAELVRNLGLVAAHEDDARLVLDEARNLGFRKLG